MFRANSEVSGSDRVSSDNSFGVQTGACGAELSFIWETSLLDESMSVAHRVCLDGDGYRLETHTSVMFAPTTADVTWSTASTSSSSHGDQSSHGANDAEANIQAQNRIFVGPRQRGAHVRMACSTHACHCDMV